MDIGSNRTVSIQMRKDIATYFGFTAATTTENTVTRRRKAHTRGVYGGLADTSATTTNVEASTWIAVKKAAEIGSGKAVKVPTKLKNAKGGTRYVTLRFPGNANVASISDFLYTSTVEKRPEFFIMPSGAKYPVVNITGDVNPGEGDTPPPA
jgi:hypothetical protein